MLGSKMADLAEFPPLCHHDKESLPSSRTTHFPVTSTSDSPKAAQNPQEATNQYPLHICYRTERLVNVPAQNYQSPPWPNVQTRDLSIHLPIRHPRFHSNQLLAQQPSWLPKNKGTTYCGILFAVLSTKKLSSIFFPHTRVKISR